MPTPLTLAQIARLYELCSGAHRAFAAEVLGPAAAGVTERDIRRLVDLGILRPEDARRLSAAAAHGSPGIFGDAVGLGVLRTHAEQATAVASRGWFPEDVNALSFAALHDRISRDPVPWSRRETAAATWANNRAAAYLTTAGAKVSADVVGRVLKGGSQAATLADAVREGTVRAVERRETAGALKSDLAKMAGTWTRDWDRVAVTELQNSANAGAAAAIAEAEGPDARVARIPNPSACPKCRELYLDDDGRPKVWALSEIAANGNNVGKKQADWVATLETTHPWCNCRTQHVPEGMGFNEQWQIVPQEWLDDPSKAPPGYGGGDTGSGARGPALLPPPQRPATSEAATAAGR